MKINITDISAEGAGIGRLDGKVVFVPNAIPGDEVEIEIIEDKGSYAKGRLVNDEPVCGGCPLIRLEYPKQLSWKEKHLRDCLERIGKLEAPLIRPIIGMEDPYHYRNKVEFKIGKGLPYCNVNCKDCPIQNDRMKEVAAHFAAEPRKNAEELVVRTAQTGEYMAFTIQESGYMLLYEGESLIHDYIKTDMATLKIEVDPQSFYQVNPTQCEKLYSQVQKYAAPKADDTVLDLYCGAGSIGLSMAGACSRVIGVESVKPAVIMANRNAVINGIVNAIFICGKAEDVVATKLQGVNADIVVLDPPRAGCKESLLKTVCEIGPDRLVYVSCNPATLARDLKYLCANGFDFVEATPVDMFPHTAHVETVVLMSRVNK